jgi:inosose dehydratase
MKEMLVGNAPCSWGTLEFDGAASAPVPYGRMLDELAQTGYTGTELGDWGYMPTDPSKLRAELEARHLVMLGAFVPVALRYASCHEEGIATAVKTARLLGDVSGNPAPFLVLADANGTEPGRTRLAGRVPASAGLSSADWKVFAGGADKVAKSVFDETGLRTVFHHHCAGYIETPQEIATLLELTDPARLGLVFDTGHFLYGSGSNESDVIGFLNRFADRVWYVHCKDCEPQVAQQARNAEWDYFEALRHGVFCELGKGTVDFPAVLRWLRSKNYEGYLLVEQDVLPGMGSPKESARRNREYLRSIAAEFIESTQGDQP